MSFCRNQLQDLSSALTTIQEELCTESAGTSLPCTTKQLRKIDTATSWLKRSLVFAMGQTVYTINNEEDEDLFLGRGLPSTSDAIFSTIPAATSRDCITFSTHRSRESIHYYQHCNICSERARTSFLALATWTMDTLFATDRQYHLHLSAANASNTTYTLYFALPEQHILTNAFSLSLATK